MESFLQDLRLGIRSLRRDRAFTLMAIVTLTVGIGAATALFSVAYGVLLRPLPYPEPNRIVQLWEVSEQGNRNDVSDPNFADWADQSRGFVAMAQFGVGSVAVVGGAEPVWQQAASVSRDFFTVMGVQPVIGRGFVPEEQQVGGPPTVIVSHTFWQNQLGGTLDLGSRTLRFGDHGTYTVVGVMPPGFDFPAGAALWTPRELYPVLESRTALNWQVIGRLRDGVTLGQARQEMSRISRHLKLELGADTWMADAAVVPLHEQLVGGVRPVLLVLLAAAGFLLLVAIANVSNLLLARMSRRQLELAVRVALGADRQRLIRHLLAESLTLSVGAGLLGLGVAWMALRALLAAEAGGLPRPNEIAVSPVAFLFAAGVSLAVAVSLALLAAFRASSADVRGGIATRERAISAGASSRRVQDGLVTLQIALTLVLLIGAGLLGRTLQRLLATDLGFRTESVLVLTVQAAREAPTGEALGLLHHQIIAGLRNLPGALEVGGSNRVPFTSGGSNGMFLIQNGPDEIGSIEDLFALLDIADRTAWANYRIASYGYFRALGIPLLRGRLFDDGDAFDAPHVAVISESLARGTWPGEDPIGRWINFANMDGDFRPMRIVGIVGDVRDGTIEREPRPTVYAAYLQRPFAASSFSYVLRVAGGAAAHGDAARRVVAEFAPESPPRIRTIEEIVAAPLAPRRFALFLLGAFGATALLLAALGIFGVTSYSVTQRTREMGIRVALGAAAGRVLRLVVRQGLILTLAGVGIGAAAAYGLTRFLAHQLYGVEPTDPLTFAGAIAFLISIALFASYLPARRAARVDPMIALRSE